MFCSPRWRSTLNASRRKQLIRTASDIEEVLKAFDRVFLVGMVIYELIRVALLCEMIPATVTPGEVGFEGPGEASQTTDPLGPFSGMSIQFKGWQSGGSQISLNGQPCSFSNACLVFSYNLDFSNPTAINSITFVGDALLSLNPQPF